MADITDVADQATTVRASRLADLEATERWATSILAAVVKAAGGEVRVDPLDVVSGDIALSRSDDPATGEVVFRAASKRSP